MKELISLNGDGNKVWFLRGVGDGDICITFNLPKQKVFMECVRIGVGNSGGQEVPFYVKEALIGVCNAMEKWDKEEPDETDRRI